MTKISLVTIKRLREESGLPVMEIKKALEESKGDEKKALELVKKSGSLKLVKRKDKSAKEGLITAYVHSGGKIAALVEIACETDFVARTDNFKKIGDEIAMQVVSMAPKNVKDLLQQDYIRDPKVKVGDLISDLVNKTGEKIEIRRFTRFALSED